MAHESDPNRIGATIGVEDSALLAELDATGLTLGTIAYVTALASEFTLTLSTASLVTDQVVAVAGIDGYRWIRGGGSGSGSGKNAQLVYVSPEGDDVHNDGSSWEAPLKTGYVGYQKIVASQGGTLFLADSTEWGGPVPGQGCWIRGDGKDVPGFLPSCACVIEGVGQTTQTLFERPGQVQLYGGSNLDPDFRNKPGVWLAAVGNASITFKNIKPVPAVGFQTFGQNHYLPWRAGWDFVRNSSDGSIQELTIASSSRAAGVSTHLVTLPAGVAIQSATRTSGIVRVTIPRPAGLASFPPWGNGVTVWIESSDTTNFPSGAFEVKLVAANANALTDWSFSYDQSGADHTTANMGVVRSPMSKPGDLIDLESSSAQFPSTRYRVSSVTVTSSTTATIAVTDIFGGHNGVNATQGATANIGQMSHEERTLASVLGPAFINCSNYMVNVDELGLYKFGPGWDFGATLAISAKATQCAFYGYFPIPSSDVPWDEDRMCAVFLEGDLLDGSLITEDCTGTQAEIRTITGSSQSELVIDCLFDSSTGYPPPPYHFSGQGGGNAFLTVVNALVADNAAGYGMPIVDGVQPLSVTGLVPVGISAASNPIGIANAWESGSNVDNPWVNLNVGTWADLRTTGKHPAAQRDISPVMSRFSNLVLPPAGWTNKTVGSGVTAGIDDPVGGTGAYRIDSTAGTTPGTTGVNLTTATYTFFGAGGTLVLAGWFRINDPSATALFQPSDFVQSSFSDATFDNSVPANPRWVAPAWLDGWQWCVFSAEMLSGSATQSVILGITGPVLGLGTTIDFFGPTFEWIPPGVSKNDAYEYIGTLKAKPRYLQPTMAGTFETQKFIAHGGLGTAARYIVGVASGQITLGAATGDAVELFDEAGNSLGVVAPLSFTVNP